MEIKITRFENGQVLIQDTEKMKTTKGEVVEVVVREYPTTKENLIGILGQVEKLEQDAIIKEQQKQEQPQVENETETEADKGE